MTANFNAGATCFERRTVSTLVFSNDPLSPRDDLIKANFTLQVIFELIIEFALCIKPLKSLKIM